MIGGSAPISPSANAVGEATPAADSENDGGDAYLPGDTGLGRLPGDRPQVATGCFGFLKSKSDSGSLHQTVKGYCTAQSRLDWCKAHGIMFEQLRITNSLVADRNPNTPLYYWQLYSLIGTDMIRGMITDFYEVVFADTETAWFRDVFIQNGDIEHHIRVQSWYWVDAMGGGAHYHGGEDRLNFHHSSNAGMTVMSAAGAKRWMEHMRTALISRGHVERFNAVDRRIVPCLIDFLFVKMRKYAIEFKWEFDRTPFDELTEFAKRS